MTLAAQIMAELRGRKTLDVLLGPAPDRDSGLPWIDLPTQAAIETRIGELIEESATEFPGNGEDFVSDWEEIAEDIRALVTPTDTP